MTMPDAPPAEFPWTKGHRRALVGLLLILLVVLVIRYAVNRAFISDPQPETPARAADLADRLDPNTCTWEELAAIPNFGEKKARAVLAYRERWLRKNPKNL